MIQRILSPVKALRTLRKTAALLDTALAGVTPEQARILRDGIDGWSILVIVCHLRDYEIAWRERVEQMLAYDNPTFISFDHLDLVERHAYTQQDLRAVLADLAARRAGFVERLAGLSDDQWLRTGLHPEQGPGAVLEVAINAGLHDLDHLEQISRCRA